MAANHNSQSAILLTINNVLLRTDSGAGSGDIHQLTGSPLTNFSHVDFVLLTVASVAAD